MSRPFLGAWLLLSAVAVLAPATASAQPKPQKPFPKGEADALLKPKPRPKRPDLAASKTPLEFIRGERIALVGNATVERMKLFGNFETLLHSRFPDKEPVVRNFGWPADEVGLRQRPSDYTRLGPV